MDIVPYFGQLLPGLAKPARGGDGSCTPTQGQTVQSDTLRADGGFGAGVKLRGNELFIGEPGAVGSIFAVGECHYFSRADSSSSFTRQSGFFSPTQTNGGSFGTEIDYDGTRVVVSEPNVAQRANVFTFSEGTATSEQEITANTYTGGSARFSAGLAINGSHLLIGAPNESLTVTSQGGVEYWTESGGTWTFQQAFTMNASKAAGKIYFGGGIAMTDDATAFIGFINGSNYTVEKWTRSGTTWTFDSTAFSLTEYDVASTPIITMDTDGTNLVIGFPSHDSGGSTSNNYGACVVVSQNGTVLTEIIGTVIGNNVGEGCSIDGSEAAVGEPDDDPSSTSNAGTTSIWDICV